MPTYDVPVKTVSTEVYRVRALNEELAMDAALRASEGMSEDDDDVELQHEIDGDPEVYYPDIKEVEET